MFTFKNRYLRQLNIDKDLLTMRNFDVYDPMKRGTSVVLDGQTLAHVEVSIIPLFIQSFLAVIDVVAQVLLNNEGTEDGSLHKLLGRCITPFGGLCICISL